MSVATDRNHTRQVKSGQISQKLTHSEHGRRPWRDDNRGFRRVPGHIIVNPVLVVGAVSNGERLVDLVEQGAEFGGIVDLLAGQGRGDDRAGLASTARCSFLQARRR